MAYVHTVTAPSALRMLTPYLDEKDARQAARYYTLPGSPSGTNAGHTPRTALDHVELVNDLSFDGTGLVTDQIKGMEERPEFAPVIDLADASGDSSPILPKPLPEFTWPAPRTWWPTFTR